MGEDKETDASYTLLHGNNEPDHIAEDNNTMQNDPYIQKSEYENINNQLSDINNNNTHQGVASINKNVTGFSFCERKEQKLVDNNKFSLNESSVPFVYPSIDLEKEFEEFQLSRAESQKQNAKLENNSPEQSSLKKFQLLDSFYDDFWRE